MATTEVDILIARARRKIALKRKEEQKKLIINPLLYTGTASGTFTTSDSKTVTVVNGVITSIV